MFQLVIQYRLSPFFSLNSQRSGDVDSLMAEHLQGKLNSTVLGLAHTTMRQLSDQFRLRTDSWFNNEIKSAIRKQLSNALRTESLHLLSPSMLIRRKEETLALIIESHTTQLHVLATIIHLLAFNLLIIYLLIVYLFLHILNCFARRNVWNIARFTMEDPPQSQLS